LLEPLDRDRLADRFFLPTVLDRPRPLAVTDRPRRGFLDDERPWVFFLEALPFLVAFLEDFELARLALELARLEALELARDEALEALPFPFLAAFEPFELARLEALELAREETLEALPCLPFPFLETFEPFELALLDALELAREDLALPFLATFEPLELAREEAREVLALPFLATFEPLELAREEALELAREALDEVVLLFEADRFCRLALVTERDRLAFFPLEAPFLPFLETERPLEELREALPFPPFLAALELA